MARNGSGTYNLPAGNPVVTGTTISSTTTNNTFSDIATALTGSISADGQTTPTGNLPMGTYAHTGVGNATVRAMYASAGQVQDGTPQYLTSVSGTNAITATASLGMTAYVTGQTFRFVAAGASTGAVTLNINAIGAKAVTKAGANALDVGDLISGAVYEVIYDGTQFQLVMPPATNSTYTGFKNRIINGAMVIDQRNASASVTPTNGSFSVDRWNFSLSQTSKLTTQQNAGSVTPPVGFSNYLGITSSSAYSITSSDYFNVNQTIEAFNTSDLGWGTANAKTVTLSFQVYSSLTGTFGGSLRTYNGYNTSYPFTYAITSANTWTQISVTIAGPTTGTWNSSGNSGSIVVGFGLGAGSTFSGTAGAWATGNFISATGATSVVGTNGATFYITGVQLEKGTTATSFDYRPYGTELSLCQRYYEQLPIGVIEGYAAAAGISVGSTAYYKVPKRAAPTLTQIVNNYFYTQTNISTTTSSYLTSGDLNALTVFRLASSASSAQFSELMAASAEL